MQKQNRNPCRAIESSTKYNAKFKNDVKPCLLKNSENHCAYCDHYFWNAGELNIEHFKSRKNHLKLETVYNNLYAACNSCNSRKRDDNYPDIEPHRPDNNDYSFEDYYYFEPATGEIELLDEDDNTSKQTLHFLNLNNPDLKKARKNFCLSWYKEKERPGKSFRFIDLI